MRKPTAFAAIALCILLGACNATHVVYVQDTVLGVDLGFSAEGAGKFALGYDRETFAIVPRFTPEDGSGPAEAMSLASVSNVQVEGINRIVFNHFVTTGSAAVSAAQDPVALRMMRNAVFDEEGE